MLTIGKRISRNGYRGLVAAVGCIEGERYYWLILRGGVVAMIPAVALEVEV